MDSVVSASSSLSLNSIPADQSILLASSGKKKHMIMCFFFPELASRIDWSAGIEFKDKELEALTTESMTGKRIADMLVQVRSKEGKPLYVLVHTEIVRRAKSHTGNEVI